MQFLRHPQHLPNTLFPHLYVCSRGAGRLEWILQAYLHLGVTENRPNVVISLVQRLIIGCNWLPFSNDLCALTESSALFRVIAFFKCGYLW